MTKWKCNKESGDCLRTVDDSKGDYLCGDCEGCKKCCTCDKDWEEQYLNEYGSFSNNEKTLLENQLQVEDEWEKKTTELREQQLA